MKIPEATAFLRRNHHAVLATFRRDGRPQLTPVLATADAEGRVVISTRESAAKIKNLRRDARASVCVFADSFFGSWVQLEGDADILSLPDAMEPLVDYYRATAGEHDDWREYRQAMRAEGRCLIRITITRVSPAG